ncbi:helix-turn-helix domain-containing protein [Epibacterium ulvae]|uniref:helix-turn-helix domain-containing protein n=1 Tax=Epibacterium ulvae TaxID=1156985 RepID=UPI0024929F73|nr:helix-turn-helix domain-containing protein [Epibacterium ulvae]
MIGRLTQRKSKSREEPSGPRSFDDFELRLGDVMRGERATMGKSLLDVQRELRIKASYIAAIENSDPSVFDTPGFIAGYVRSYARYLNMDADEAFATFCSESGFEVAHGMSAGAESRGKDAGVILAPGTVPGTDLSSNATPYLPAERSFFSDFEPRAIGSLAVLVALIGGIAYGAVAVVNEVQRVQLAPVEQVPFVQADLDPLDSVTLQAAEEQDTALDALDRLYRPQALDVPVLVARDAPISTLDPDRIGSFIDLDAPTITLADVRVGAEVLPVAPSFEEGESDVIQGPLFGQPQVVEARVPTLTMVAVRPAWVQVTAADGSVIYETIMEPEQSFEIPLTENPPRLRTGESSGIYFATNDQQFGPVGARGQVTKNVELSVEAVSENFAQVDIAEEQHQLLAKVVAELQTAPVAE